MHRWLLTLALCLLLASDHSDLPLSARMPEQVAFSVTEDRKPDDGKALPDQKQMVQLAREKPVVFLESCLRYYQRKIQGYTVTMQKQERLGGRLQRTEVIHAAFREKPYSVYMEWLEGARLAERALYVQGQNGDQTLARPAGRMARLIAGDISARDPEGADARKSGRYTIKQFGLKAGMERTLASWKKAQDQGALHVEYLGEKKVKEAGDRLCLVLRRSPYSKPEEDGVSELTIYVDKESWLQVGSVLKAKDGKVIGSYFFRNIKLNPKFDPNQFTRESLVPAKDS